MLLPLFLQFLCAIWMWILMKLWGFSGCKALMGKDISSPDVNITPKLTRNATTEEDNVAVEGISSPMPDIERNSQDKS